MPARLILGLVTLRFAIAYIEQPVGSWSLWLRLVTEYVNDTRTIRGILHAGRAI